MEPTEQPEGRRKPDARAATRPRQRKKVPAARVAPPRMPWRLRLVILAGGLGIVIMMVVMLRTNAQLKLQCRVQEQILWERMPETMAKQLLDHAREDALLQAALDAQRQTSWWAWLMTPAHPPKRGCDTWGFF